VIEANKTWASVVAKNGRPIDSLLCVYDGDVLTDAMAREKGRRTRGEYRIAVMTRPLELRDARIVWREAVGGQKVVDSIVVTVTESWDDRTFDLSGRLIGEDSGRFDFRYTLRNSSEQPWIEASQSTGCHHTGWWIVNVVQLGPSS
jgi:hypothetical protein